MNRIRTHNISGDRKGDLGGGGAPISKKIWFFGDFSHEIPQIFSPLPPLGAIFFKYAPPNLKSWIRPWIGTDCTGSCKSNYHTITTKHNRETIVNFEQKSSRQYHIWSSVRKWHYFSTNCWQLPRNFLKAKMGLFFKNPWRTNLF
jgi:hypothetical protein